MSKQTELFASLMQALSHHLRPAPYPYGLLTLRLLGKLGGKNRQFLRNPLLLCDPNEHSADPERELQIAYSWISSSELDSQENVRSVEAPGRDYKITLPLDRALEMLKRIACAQSVDVKNGSESSDVEPLKEMERIPWADSSRLLTSPIENIDFSFYRNDVMEATKNQEANASLRVVQTAVVQTLDNTTLVRALIGDESKPETGTPNGKSNGDVSQQSKAIALALMHASMIDSIKEKAVTSLKSFAMRIDPIILSDALVLFISDPSSGSTIVGIRFLEHILQMPEAGDEKDGVTFARMSFSDSLLRSLCERSTSTSWDRQAGIQDTICLLIGELGGEWARKFEAMLINAALLSVKIVPRELSNASLGALRFFIRVCSGLYGVPWRPNGPGDSIVWDVLASDADKGDASATKPPQESSVAKPEGVSTTKPKDASAMKVDESLAAKLDSPVAQPEETKPSLVRPIDDVVRMALFEMASAQQIVR